MKYFKCITDFDFKDVSIHPVVEISKDEFLNLCENFGSYSLSHGVKDGEKVHLISVSKYIL